MEGREGVGMDGKGNGGMKKRREKWKGEGECEKGESGREKRLGKGGGLTWIFVLGAPSP